MSDNPFDVFAADFKAAIPATQAKSNGTQNNDPPINIMAQPAPAPVPVMKAPAAPVMNSGAPGMRMNQPPQQMGGMGMMNMHPQQGMYGGNGFGMNAMAPAPYGGGAPMNGAPNGMGGGGMSGAPMAGGAMVPAAQQSNPYAMNMGGMPYGQPPAPPPQMGMNTLAPQMGMGMSAPSPGRGQNVPTPPSPYGMAPPQPFGAPAAAAPPAPQLGAPPADPFFTPPSPSPNAYPGAFSTGPAPVSNDPYPFGAPAPPPFPPQPEAEDPWAQAPAPPPGNDALVPFPNGAADSDPFGVFDNTDILSVASPVPVKQYTAEQVSAAADDPWNSTPFGSNPEPANNSYAAPAPAQMGGGILGDDALVPAAEDGHKSGELPPGGEWYDARIFTPTLGVMFFKPQELTDSLFLQTDKSLVDALDDRPVVAFIVEGSSARAAGVELGHVLLKVNGIDVKNPKEASRLIKEGPRPLPLLFYVPDTSVVVAEGEHMVKYDTRETMAPNSAKDWKPKYCVIGGIIAQPWMMNMYRSKSEYDIAVIETQARRPVSVKVKQFSLQGARIQNDWQGPQMVKYKNKLHPWKYIVILPISRNPIKISSPNLANLKPVHEGIRRVLMAQNRYAPSPARSAGDPYAGGQQQGGRDPYQQGGGGSGANYSQPPPANYGQPPPANYGQPPPANYGQPPPQQQQQYSQQPYGHQDGGQHGGYGGQEQYSGAGGAAGERRRTQY